MKTYEQKSVSQLKKIADKNFSIWIRRRDAEGDQNVCFTCGRVLPVSDLQAGHFVSRVFNVLRYHEKNVWPQCKACNIFGYGRMDVYATRLVEKFGPKILTWFQEEKRKTKQFTKRELIEIINKYKVENQDRGM